jgi:hypothetical protein
MHAPVFFSFSFSFFLFLFFLFFLFSSFFCFCSLSLCVSQGVLLEEQKTAIASELARREQEVQEVTQEKEAYMQRLAELELKLISGGTRVEETSEFKAAMSRERERLEREHQDREAQIEVWPQIHNALRGMCCSNWRAGSTFSCFTFPFFSLLTFSCDFFFFFFCLALPCLAGGAQAAGAGKGCL